MAANGEILVTAYLLGAIVRLWQRATKGGISKLERHRARSIAKATSPLHADPLPPEDEAFVQAHHEIVVEWRTAEQPVVSTVRRRHLYRPPSQRQLAAMRARRLKPVREFAADPLSAPLAGPLAPAVIAASVPVSPAPWHMEGPTGVFSRDWIEKAMAGGAR
jgi:hypothetical protein